MCAICFVLVLLKCQGEALKTFDFVDYKDVPVEDSGWLKLKQDPKNPLHLPHSFAFCTNVFRWYSRSSYIGYITIKLLDEERKYMSEFSIAQSGKPLLWEFSKWKFDYTPKGTKPKSFQWNHVCGFLDMKSEVFSVYMNGEHLGNRSTHDPSAPSYGPVIRFKQEQQFELYIGTHRTVPGNMANRLIGMVQGFNMYTYIDMEMLRNISGCQFQKQGDFVSWDTAKWVNSGTNDSLILTKELEFEEICPDGEPEESTVSVIPLPILDYQGALDRCKSLNMRMTVPFNSKEHEQVISGGNSKAMVKHCFEGGRQKVLFAMQKSADGRYFDPQTNVTTDDYAKSHNNWGNDNDKHTILAAYTGMHFNPDGSKGRVGFYNYAELQKAQWKATQIVCFSCISNKVPVLKIRGLCPGSYFDQLIYFLLDKAGFVHFYGKTKSHIGKHFPISSQLNVCLK